MSHHPCKIISNSRIIHILSQTWNPSHMFAHEMFYCKENPPHNSITWFIDSYKNVLSNSILPRNKANCRKLLCIMLPNTTFNFVQRLKVLKPCVRGTGSKMELVIKWVLLQKDFTWKMMNIYTSLNISSDLFVGWSRGFCIKCGRKARKDLQVWMEAHGLWVNDFEKLLHKRIKADKHEINLLKIIQEHNRLSTTLSTCSWSFRTHF